MKSVLISIRPKWCEKICHEIGKDETGKPIYEKRIEVRKSAPKEVPFKAYIYCTRIIDKKHCRDEFDIGIWKGNEHVIGEFICDKVYNLIDAFGGIVFADENLNQLEPQLFRDMSCLTDEQTADYLGDKDGYGLHITDLRIYDKPKELSEFYVHKEDSSNYCYGCVHSDLNTHYPCCECLRDKKRRAYLKHPPQSWQYVEEVKV